MSVSTAHRRMGSSIRRSLHRKARWVLKKPGRPLQQIVPLAARSLFQVFWLVARWVLMRDQGLHGEGNVRDRDLRDLNS
jgi:hypothetical protein